MSERALEGLKVLELGDFISAAYASKLLADLGAEVIKVEPPEGDSSRRQGPFPGDERHGERSGLFLFLNANKRSVTLDLTQPRGSAICRRLAQQADIVVHNLPPAELEACGLDYDALAEGHPELVMSSITVFGYDTPYRDWKGHALTATAASGISARIGDPGRAPLWIPYCAADFQGGIHGATAALLALRARRSSGEGQHAWVSIVEVIGTYLAGSALPGFVLAGQLRSRAGTHMEAFYPWQVTPSADGYFEVITMVDEQWQRFVELMGEADAPWAADERLQARWTAWQWADELDQHWYPWVAERTTEELTELFESNGLPFHPVNSVAVVAESEHLRERGFWRRVTHPEAGEYTTLGPPYRFSETPWEIRRPPPLLGEHNDEVLRSDLGVDAAEFDDLVAAGVVAAGVVSS